jgi:hypothetical protein
MKDLIEALNIFFKYGNPEHPTHCEHDVMFICGINPEIVSDEDKSKLDDLGFFVEDGGEGFKSFRFGSA